MNGYEIDKIHKKMVELAEREQMAERDFGNAVIKARLRLLETQDEMKWHEEQYQLERERLREKSKRLQSEITPLEKIVDDSVQKAPGTVSPSLNSARVGIQRLEKRLEELQVEEDKLFANLRERRKNGRKIVILAEEEVRFLEAAQVRRREDFAAQRERMQAGLQRLEDKTLDLEPADRFRDVGRKLDTLRRNVGELRRALERQEKESRKKP